MGRDDLVLGIVVHELDRLRFCISDRDHFVINDRSTGHTNIRPEQLVVGDVVLANIRRVPEYVKWSAMSPYEAVSFQQAEAPYDLVISGAARNRNPKDLRIRCRVQYLRYDERLEADVYSNKYFYEVFDAHDLLQGKREADVVLSLALQNNRRVSSLVISDVEIEEEMPMRQPSHMEEFSAPQRSSSYNGVTTHLESQPRTRTGNTVHSKNWDTERRSFRDWDSTRDVENMSNRSAELHVSAKTSQEVGQEFAHPAMSDQDKEAVSILKALMKDAELRNLIEDTDDDLFHDILTVTF